MSFDSHSFLSFQSIGKLKYMDRYGRLWLFGKKGMQHFCVLKTVRNIRKLSQFLTASHSKPVLAPARTH